MLKKECAEKNYVRMGEGITYWSVGINVALSLLKILSGYFGHSSAIMADGFHSASDLLTDFGILATLRFSQHPPDTYHPYGHRKVESLTAFLLGITLALIGFSFVYAGITKVVQIFHQNLIHEINPIVLLGALLTVIVKEWIFRATEKVGRKLRNESIIANAWHHRSDAFSSMCTFSGVSLAIWGGPSFLIFDPLMTIAVAIFIVKTSYAIICHNGAVLLDAGADEKLLTKIKNIASAIDGVMDVHDVRSRFHGSTLFVDLHVVVSPTMSVYDSHQLCDEIEKQLKMSIEILEDLVVHIEPYTVEA
jgi:cation diffusion facilitator family transporter